MREHECYLCNDKGFVRIEGSRSVKKCTCTLKREILKYLTPRYNSLSIKKFKMSMKDGEGVEVDICSRYMRDILMVNTKGTFDALVKSFLVSTRMKYSHFTVSAFEAVLAWVNSADARCSLTDIYSPDYLFLLLDSDPPNSKYDELLCSILKQRRAEGKHSWICSPRPVDCDQFKELYGYELSAYVSESFKKI